MQILFYSYLNISSFVILLFFIKLLCIFQQTNGQGFPYATQPPGHNMEMFREAKEQDKLFFTRRSYADFIEGLKERKQLNHSKVEEVFYKVRRADFINGKPYFGYGNIPYAFEHQVTLEQPAYHALVLEHMVDHIKNGSRVLDIGSGQGYIASCLAHLVGTHGKVYALEHVPLAVNQSLKNIKISCPYLLTNNLLEVLEKDGRWGHPEGGPYDVIFFGGAVPEVSSTILAQLKPNGRIVAPVGNVWRQNLSVIDKYADGSYTSKIIKKVSCDFLCDLDFQMHPEEYYAPTNGSKETKYTKFEAPPGVRRRDYIKEMFFNDSPQPTKFTLSLQQLVKDDSIDDRLIFNQEQLDIIYGVNKTKPLL